MRILSALFAAALWAGAASAAPLSAYSGLFVFGDSLSDTGNLYAELKKDGLTPYPSSPPYFKGRFSNGYVWSDLLGGRVGSGASFAVGGAEALRDKKVDPGSPENWAVAPPDFPAQVALYDSKVSNPGDRPLGAIWFGANDLFYALRTGQNGAEAIGGAVNNIIGGMGALNARGFSDFLLMNLPDLGATPRFVGTPFAGLATQASRAFNAALWSGLDAVEAGVPGVTITRLDVAGLFRTMQADPAAYGLTNMTEACIQPTGGAYGAVPACDGYAFFDSVHPTAALHGIIADNAGRALAPVPLPASGLLLIAGIGALALRRR